MVPAICRGGFPIRAKVRDAPAGLLFAHLRGRCFRQNLAGAVDASSAGRDRDMAPRCAEQDDKLTGGARPAVPVVLIHALHHPTTATTAIVIGVTQLFGLPQSPRGFLYLQIPDRSLAFGARQRRDSDNAASCGRSGAAVPNAKLPAAARATVQRAVGEFFSLVVVVNSVIGATRRVSVAVAREVAGLLLGLFLLRSHMRNLRLVQHDAGLPRPTADRCA